MIYCIYCGTPSDDNANFCPHCGATLVKPEAAAQQVAPDRQTYTPADGAYAGQTEEDRKQAFDCGSTQTETPTYYYTPCGENMYLSLIHIYSTDGTREVRGLFQPAEASQRFAVASYALS